MKSGYVMVNCKGLNLLGGSTPQTIAGLYDDSMKAIKSGKAIFAQDCIYGEGHPMSPVAVMGQIEDAHTIVFTSSILQIWVTDSSSGNVTVVSLLASTRTSKK